MRKIEWLIQRNLIKEAHERARQSRRYFVMPYKETVPRKVTKEEFIKRVSDRP